MISQALRRELVDMDKATPGTAEKGHKMWDL